MSRIAPSALIGPDVRLADDVVVEEHVILGRPGEPHAPVIVGRGSVVRAGTIVYPDVRIGDGLQTGHHAVIRSGTTIGNGCLVGTHVVVDGDCTVGDRVRLQTGVYLPTNTTLEDDVFVGPNATLTNDRAMASYARGLRSRDEPLVGPTVRRGARIGANSTILPDLEIGEDAVVGAGAVVTADVPPRTIVVGVPAQPIGIVPERERIADPDRSDRAVS